MVSKKEQKVYEEVLHRDRVMTWDNHDLQNPTFLLTSFLAWMSGEPWVCVAPLIDPSQWGHCSGEMTRAHVHSHTA